MNGKRRTRVLFVDDDQAFLEKAKECLSLHVDMDLETALSSEDALKKIEKKRPDVIVCDIQKPSTNGFNLLKTLRDKGDTTPFVVFTLTDKEQLAVQSFKLGANGFIGKVGDPATVFWLLSISIKSLAKDSSRNSNKPSFLQKISKK
jgi:DNA-binding NarL/FixJ family response regulator